MNAQHTPGPWHRNIKPATHYNTIFSGRNTHVTRLAVEGKSEEEVEANCALIVAAPDMLAALREAVRVLEYAADVLEAPAASHFRETISDARAAIAKAEGRK